MSYGYRKKTSSKFGRYKVLPLYFTLRAPCIFMWRRPFYWSILRAPRGWVEDKLLELAKVFCIDVCAYAVMSNHTHLVLYVDDKKAERLNDKAIVIRWHKL